MIYVQYFDLSERKAYDKLNPNRDALTQKAPTMSSFFFFFFFFFFSISLNVIKSGATGINKLTFC